MDSEKLPITGPCPIDLDAIGFDRRAKKAFCTHCSKNVVNLSNMTEPEARSFLREYAGETMCVSYARKDDGAIKFEPQPAPIVPIGRLRARRSNATTATAAAGLALALAACTPHGDDRPQVDRVEEHDPDSPRTIIPIEPRKPQDIPMAGSVEVPEPTEVLDGEIEIPEDMVEGEMEIHDPDEVQPCDGTPTTADDDIERPRPRLRGKVELPRRHDL